MIDFKSLQIWQRSHKLAVRIYKITANFPPSEIYGLTSQLRRCSVSVPSNIAEGCGRNSDGELRRFLHIAMGSSAEFEYQVLLSNNLGYISDEEYNSLNNEIVEVRKMLNTFIAKVSIRKK